MLNFTNILIEIAKTIFKNSESIFQLDTKKQKQILNAFPKPKDLFERSYFQYKCQMKKQSALLVTAENIMALTLLPIYYIKLALARIDILQLAGEKCAVFLTSGITIQTIPECLSKEYNEIIPCKIVEENMHIGKQEKNLLYKLFIRYWYSPYFIFKCMLKIGMYASIIEKYNPKAIITCNEYSYTSSVLTEYCRMRVVEHINVMHGEKLFNIRDSFFEYERYYVWDEHYIILLTDLRADNKQFRIAIPPSVILDCKNNQEPLYDYTYYLAGEKTRTLITIRDFLLNTGVPSSRICIRYHPRYRNVNEIMHIYKGFHIESPTEVPLNISLSRTKYPVSLYSTVLYQAYESGKKIIIDDITDNVKYKKLKELRYIMLEKPHGKLSEHIKNAR